MTECVNNESQIVWHRSSPRNNLPSSLHLLLIRERAFVVCPTGGVSCRVFLSSAEKRSASVCRLFVQLIVACFTEWRPLTQERETRCFMGMPCVREEREESALKVWLTGAFNYRDASRCSKPLVVRQTALARRVYNEYENACILYIIYIYKLFYSSGNTCKLLS